MNNLGPEDRLTHEDGTYSGCGLYPIMFKATSYNSGHPTLSGEGEGAGYGTVSGDGEGDGLRNGRNCYLVF